MAKTMFPEREEDMPAVRSDKDGNESAALCEELVPVDLLFALGPCEVPRHSIDASATVKGSPVLPLAALPVTRMIADALQQEGGMEAYHRHCLAAGAWPPSLGARDFARALRRKARSVRWGWCTSRPVIAALDNDCLFVQGDLELCCLAKVFGKSWIKASMLEEAHARWLARRIEGLDAVVARTSRRVFYNPVDHPAYRKARVARRDSIRLDRIRQLLGPLGPGLTGLDIGCNMGYVSHHLQRQGWRMTGVDYDENHLAVAKALNVTYGLDVRFENCYFRQFAADRPFDITLALTVLYHMFYRQEEQNIPEQARMEKAAALHKIDALTRHALIWESGPEPQREIDFIRSNSGLCDYHSLGLTQGTGKRREVGVFLRPGTEITDYLKRRYTQNPLW